MGGRPFCGWRVEARCSRLKLDNKQKDGDQMTKRMVNTAIILAGGRSSRMGMDKAFLRLGEKTLVERAIETLKAIFPEVVVVINQQGFSFPGVKIVHDRVPHLGPLGGILAGLGASSSFYSFVVGVDMPFLHPGLIRLLVDSADADAVMPVTSRGVQPLFAIYAKTCVPRIAQHVEMGDLRHDSFHSDVKIRHIPVDLICKVDAELISFFNINTPDDLVRAEERLAQLNAQGSRGSGGGGVSGC